MDTVLARKISLAQHRFFGPLGVGQILWSNYQLRLVKLKSTRGTRSTVRHRSCGLPKRVIMQQSNCTRQETFKLAKGIATFRRCHCRPLGIGTGHLRNEAAVKLLLETGQVGITRRTGSARHHSRGSLRSSIRPWSRFSRRTRAGHGSYVLSRTEQSPRSKFCNFPVLRREYLVFTDLSQSPSHSIYTSSFFLYPHFVFTLRIRYPMLCTANTTFMGRLLSIEFSVSECLEGHE